MLDQHPRLLAATAKDERVAALEAQDALASLGQRHQLQRDIGLFGRWFAATFAGKDTFDVTRRHSQQIRRNQCVMNNYIGLSQGVIGKQGRQPRPARARANQPDRARFELREISIVEGRKMGAAAWFADPAEHQCINP